MTAAITFGMAVAGVDDGDAGGKIDVAVAFHIPDFRILRLVGIDLRHDANTARNRIGFAGLDLGILQRGVHGVLLRKNSGQILEFHLSCIFSVSCQ